MKSLTPSDLKAILHSKRANLFYLEHFKSYQEQKSKLPYINMTSLTNGQRFHLFIDKQLKDKEKKGYFSCYGLSSSSTVSLF